MKPTWKEGVFVKPQHFQQFERYFETQLYGRLDQLQSYGFGIEAFKINEAQLQRGLVQIDRMSAVMPDGVMIKVGPDESIPSLTLDVSEVSFEGTLEIFLAVPDESSRGTKSYASADGAKGARYVEVKSTLNDVYGGARQADIDCIRPNVQLLSSSEERDGYICLKVLELLRSESGSLRADQEYCPPLLRVGANAWLSGELRKLVEKANAKRNAVAERYEGRSTALVDFGAVDMATFWFLHTLNSHVGMLTHLATSGRTHPEVLYLALMQLHGSLSTFEPQAKPKKILPYDHLDLTSSFQFLLEESSRLVDRSLDQSYKRIPLENPQRGFYVARDVESDLLQYGQLFLVARGKISEEKLKNELPRHVRVTSFEQVSKVVKRALPALDMQVDTSPPSAIPVRPENLYMRFSQRGQHWDYIRMSSTIAIWQPVEPDHVELELLVVESA